MKKHDAIQLLGGTVTLAAEAIGIKSQAVSQWPDELPPRLVDRVQAALWRLHHSTAPLPELAAAKEASHV